MTVKISEFPSLTDPVNYGSVVPIIQNGSNYTLSVSSLGVGASILTLSGAIHTLTESDSQRVLRFTNNSTKTVLLPSGFTGQSGSIYTIRNAGIGNLTISALDIQAVNSLSGAEIVSFNTTAQVVFVESNVWDIM
jgi:hypothetical protein